MEISTEGNVWIIKHDNGTETRGTKEQVLAILNPAKPQPIEQPKPMVASLPEPPIPMTTVYKTTEVSRPKKRNYEAYVNIVLIGLQLLIIVLIVMYSAKGG